MANLHQAPKPLPVGLKMTEKATNLFEDGRKVDSVANRMVFFDAALPHSGVHCTDTDRRLVLNINMFLDNAPHRQ